MRIAQVSPLYESVPPKLYGGTERVVAFLTDALIAQGHEVTLFASGDSSTQAALVPGAPRALRLGDGCREPIARHLEMLEEVCRRADDFDIIHFHLDYLGFPAARRCGVPHVTTLHGRLDDPELEPLFRSYCDTPLVSISNAQRAPLGFANWKATIYHGLPPDLYSFHPQPGRYLAFLGRLSPVKRVDRAVEIAHQLGMPLRVAAKINPEERDYYEREIAPLFAERNVEFLGEIGEADKDEFLGNAAALLFPVDWPEPFGLVMIEAMACGTPVVGYRRGSVSEVIRDGVSGYVVDSVEAAVAATARALALPRRRCRAYFERRFSVARMAADYLDLYRDLAEHAPRHLPAHRPSLDLVTGADPCAETA